MGRIFEISFLVRCGLTLAANTMTQFIPIFSRVRGPFFVNWQISYACNAVCDMCNTHALAKAIRPAGDYKKIVEHIDELKTCHLSITGGEPFLNRDLPDILAKLKNKNMYVNVNTNGSVLEQSFDWLFDSRIDSLTISIDSAHKDLHDKWRSLEGLTEKIKRSALQIRRRRRPGTLKITFRCVIHKLNFEQLDQMYLDLKPFCDDFEFQPLHSTVFFEGEGNDEKHLFSKYKTQFSFDQEDQPVYIKSMAKLRRLNRSFRSSFYDGFQKFLFSPYEYSKKFKCFTSFFYLTVNPAGEVFPCTFMLEKIGSVKESSLKEIWSSSAVSEVRRRHKKKLNECFCWCGIAKVNNWLSPSVGDKFE